MEGARLRKRLSACQLRSNVCNGTIDAAMWTSLQNAHSFPAHAGTCAVVSGPCDGIDKGCCFNAQVDVNYCSTPTDANATERVACNVAPNGDQAGLRCELCGGADQPCCFASDADAKTASPGALALGQDMCNDDSLGCMLHEGAPFDFGKCGSILTASAHRLQRVREQPLA